MPAPLRTSKLFHTLNRLLLVGGLAACRSATPPPAVAATDETLPRRVVLALDGVDYRDIQTARERGLFRAFRAPGRLISTFPSISDIAWHAIFGVQPPAGYQRVFYSLRQDAVLGEPLDAIRPIEYERRMDAAFDAKFHHLGAYLISGPITRREVDTDMKTVLRTRGRGTVYVYNVGPDALQHTRGDIAEYLAYLDQSLTTLLEAYRQRTGRELEVVLLSDHGHNRARDATFLPLIEGLKARGFVTGKSLHMRNEVAFSVDGVTTGFGVFCDPDSVTRVASIIAGIEGVDIVTQRLTDTTFAVYSDRGTARITVGGPPGAPRYAYVPLTGDPLRADSAVARMRRDGVFGRDGADADSWVRYTKADPYPAAVVRIVHGHLDATRNPAPILVSLDDRYRVGLGFVSVTNRLRPLGGTHGALSATNSLGVVMTNFQDTPDELAMSVRRHFGAFDDLLEPETPRSWIRIATPPMLRADRFTAPQWPSAPPMVADSVPLLVVRVADRLRPLPADSLWLQVSLRQTRGDRLIATTALPASRWIQSRDGRDWAISVHDVRLTDLVPGDAYVVQVRVDGFRPRGDGSSERWAKTLVDAPVRGARDGLPWTF